VTEHDLFHRFALASVIAAGGGVFGLGWALFSPRTWIGRLATMVTAVGVVGGLVSLLAPDDLTTVLTVMATLGLATVVGGSGTVWHFAGRVLRPMCRPRLMGGAALLASAGGWGYEAWRYDAGCADSMNETLARVAESVPPESTAVATAQTDSGATIALHSPIDPRSATSSLTFEQESPTLNLYAGRIIRRGKPSDESNCHGWVFTGGRFNLLGRNVEPILADNGYALITTPEAGDLCVYRNSQGEVSHTGLVRAVLYDGTVLVESKWGRMGVYLHAAEESCYGTDFRYYHTSRGGHLLRGVSEQQAPATSSHP
jgi:hypothetical protein